VTVFFGLRLLADGLRDALRDVLLLRAPLLLLLVLLYAILSTPPALLKISPFPLTALFNI